MSDYIALATEVILRGQGIVALRHDEAAAYARLLDTAGLLATPEHNAAVAARALQEAADEVRAIFNDPDRTRPLRRDAEVATDFASDPEWAAMVVEDRADRIEREGGASDADA